MACKEVGEREEEDNKKKCQEKGTIQLERKKKKGEKLKLDRSFRDKERLVNLHCQAFPQPRDEGKTPV